MMKYPITGLAIVLKEISKQKEAGSSAPAAEPVSEPAPEAAPVEEAAAPVA